MIETLFQIPLIRFAVSLAILARGAAFLALGNEFRASADFCWVYRVSGVRLLRRAALRALRTLVPAGTASAAENRILRSFVKSPQAERHRERFRRAAQDPAALPRDLIVLKCSAPGERGVLLIKYTPSFEKAAAVLDVDRLFERYRIVLEPSWAGVCDPAILMYASAGYDVVVQTAETEDREFLEALGSSLRPISMGSGDWADPDLFAPGTSDGKEYDLVMVANWARYKQHEKLFRALGRLQGKRLRLLLLGFPWSRRTRDDIRREMSRYPMQHVETTILEQLPPEAVADYLRRSKVFLLLSKKEGSNKAITEAFFTGVPAIVYDRSIGGARSMINAQTGMLSSYERLHETVAYMVERHGDFEPRAWALQHTGSVVSTRRLNDFLREIAFAAGEPWTRDVVEKANSPNLAYKRESAEAGELAQLWNRFGREPVTQQSRPAG